MQLKTDEQQLNLLGLLFLSQGSSHEVSLLARANHLPVAVLSSWLGLLEDFLMAFLHEPLHGLDLPFNEAITLWVVWWWGGVSDAKTCKKGTEFFAIKGRAIVTHNLIMGAFFTEQLH